MNTNLFNQNLFSTNLSTEGNNLLPLLQIAEVGFLLLSGLAMILDSGRTVDLSKGDFDLHVH